MLFLRQMRRVRLSPALCATVAVTAAVLAPAASTSARPSGPKARHDCKLAGIRYVGSTSQKKRVCLTLSKNGKRLREWSFGYRFRCSDGVGASGNARTTSRTGIPLGRSGRFAYTAGFSFFRGSASGTGASGTLRLGEQGVRPSIDPTRPPQVVTCDTGVVRWTARKTAS